MALSERANRMLTAISCWIMSWTLEGNVENGIIKAAQWERAVNILTPGGDLRVRVNNLNDRNLISTFGNHRKLMTGAVLQTMDTVLEQVFQKASVRFKHADSDLRNCFISVHYIRNAYAHDPMNPTWHTGNPDCLGIFEIPMFGWRFDTRRLKRGKGLDAAAWGGWKQLMLLMMYATYLVCLNDGCPTDECSQFDPSVVIPNGEFGTELS